MKLISCFETRLVLEHPRRHLELALRLAADEELEVLAVLVLVEVQDGGDAVAAPEPGAVRDPLPKLEC